MHEVDSETYKRATKVGNVSIFPITQATTATFTDLYFRLTFFFFIESGEKFVETKTQGELLGQQGDLMIFPPGAMVTMQNRPRLNDTYRATGVSFSHDLIYSVFSSSPQPESVTDVQIVRHAEHNPGQILALLKHTMSNGNLPEPIRQNRELEPLIWLRELGLTLPSKIKDNPISRVRQLVESDLIKDWRAADVAGHFAMSEATFRRWLGKAGQGFAKTLLHTRLEHGLTQLQTTDTNISEIALNCGFRTPSHFSDAFKKRFGIRPKEIRSPPT